MSIYKKDLKIHLKKMLIKDYLFGAGTIIDDYIAVNLTLFKKKKFNLILINIKNPKKNLIINIPYHNIYINKEINNTYTLIGKNSIHPNYSDIFIYKFSNIANLKKSFEKYVILNKKLLKKTKKITIIQKSKSSKQNNCKYYFDALINKVLLNNSYYIYARLNPLRGTRKYQVFNQLSVNNFSNGKILNLYKDNILNNDINIYDATFFSVNNKIYGFFGYYYKKSSPTKFYIYNEMRLLLAVSEDSVNFNILNYDIIENYNFYKYGLVMNNNKNDNINKIYLLNSKGLIREFISNENNSYLENLENEDYYKINLNNIISKNTIKKKLNNKKNPKKIEKKIVKKIVKKPKKKENPVKKKPSKKNEKKYNTLLLAKKIKYIKLN
jgi:hypothetical protein